MRGIRGVWVNEWDVICICTRPRDLPSFHISIPATVIFPAFDKGTAENHSLRFLTWLFHGCPQWIVEPMIDAMMQANTHHPFRANSAATTLLLQGIGRTASGSAEQRQAFDFLLRVPSESWNKNHLACASFLLSRNDSAPKLLSRKDVEFLSRVVAARMQKSLGTNYTATFIYAPSLLVGLLRWRLREPQAMVAGTDSVADEMLIATENTIEDLSSRIAGQPRLRKYRDVLRPLHKSIIHRFAMHSNI